jgi:hypothetical protein
MSKKPIPIDFTKADFLKRLFENNGNAYKTYTEMGLPYSQYRIWLTDEAFAKEVEAARKKCTEFVESQFYNKLKEGDLKAIMFYLKTRGGYTEKKDINITSDNTVDVTATLESIKKELESE